MGANVDIVRNYLFCSWNVGGWARGWVAHSYTKQKEIKRECLCDSPRLRLLWTWWSANGRSEQGFS